MPLYAINQKLHDESRAVISMVIRSNRPPLNDSIDTQDYDSIYTYAHVIEQACTVLMFIDRRTRLAHGVLDQPRRVPPATLDEYRAAFDAASNLYGAEEISEKDFNLVTLVLAQVYLS